MGTVNPAKAVTLEAFQELLRTGNLLAIDELAGIVAEMTHLEFATSADFARWLVERKWVTRWQAQMMLAGSNRFFLGKYKLLERIGAGGMGTVFKARQQGLGRFVALKVMADALLGDEASVTRFHREIRSAAALEHPNIVTTFDADCVGGKHFLVMEFVDGENLQAVVKQRGRLPMEEACEYIRQAALGLAHAHERGMIHRDIKPANLLVAYPVLAEAGNEPPAGDAVAQPVVKILDFGLARLANETHVDAAITQTGQIMGTADYIAPEQARDTKAADIRSDIYSLGCTLFRLLAGEVPFKGQSVMEKLMARALGEAPRIRTIRPELPADLDECLARMVARDPAARPQTPVEVASAMALFAAAPGRVVPFSRREAASAWGLPASGKGLDAASVVDPGLEQFLAVLATDAEGDSGRADLADDTSPTGQGSGSGGATRVNNPFAQMRKKTGAARRAATSSQRLAVKSRRRYGTLAIPVVLVLAVAAGLLWYRRTTTWIEVDWPAEERKGGTLEIDGREPILSGKLSFPGRAGRRHLRLERKGYEPIEEEWQLAGGETIHFRPEWKLTPLTVRRREAAALKEAIESRGLAPGDALLRSKSPETDALREKCSAFIGRWLNTPEAAQITVALGTLPAPVDGLMRAQIPDYELRVSGNGDPAAAPAALVAIIGDSRMKHAANIPTVAFSPDDAWVAAGDDAGFLKLWNAATGEEIRSIRAHDHGVTRLAFSPDGKSILTGSHDATAKIWGLPSFDERHTLRGHANQVRSVAWSPVEDLVATAGIDRTISLWKPSDGTLVRTIDEGLGEISSLAFSPDGQSLAVGCYEPSTVFILDAASGAVRHTLRGHEKAILAMAFNGDGSILATGGYEPDLKLWNTATGEPVVQSGLHYSSGISSIAFSADGKAMAVGVGDGAVVLHDAATWAQVQTLRRHQSGVWGMAFSHRGRKIVTAGPDREVRICDATTGKEVVDVAPRIHRLAASPDGRYLALGLHDGTIGVWDIAAGKMHGTLLGHSQPASSLAFSPDSRLLAAGTYGGGSNLRIWEVAGQNKLAVIDAHHGTVSGLAFRPDAQMLASASHDGLVKFWNPENGSLKETFNAKLGGVSGMALSADWSTLALGFNPHGRNGLAVIVDRTGERKPKTLDGNWGGVFSVAFGAEDKTLVVGHPGHCIKFWNLPKGTERGIVEGTGLFALNADASLLAVETSAGIVLCDPVLGTALAEVSTGRAELRLEQLLFTPEGRHLAVVLGDGTVHALRLPATRE